MPLYNLQNTTIVLQQFTIVQFTPKTILDILGICDKNMFLTIKMLVHILVTLLISDTTNNKKV